MKKKVLLVTILLIIVGVSTLAFATDQQPINEEVAYTTEGVEEVNEGVVSEEVVSEEVVVTNEDVEPYYKDLYADPVYSSSGSTTLTLDPITKGVTSINLDYQNYSGYTTTISVYRRDAFSDTKIGGYTVAPGEHKALKGVPVSGDDDVYIKFDNVGGHVYPIDGYLRVAQY